MQKREQSKLGGGTGGAAAPPAKRGRPFGSTSSNAAAAAAAAAADAAAPSTLLGPSLHVHSSFAGQLHQNPSKILLNFRIEIDFFSYFKSEPVRRVKPT